MKIQVFWNMMLCQSPSRHEVMSQDLNLQVHNKNKRNSYSYVIKSSNSKTGKICQVVSYKPQILIDSIQWGPPQSSITHPKPCESIPHPHNLFFLTIFLILFPICTSRSLSTLQISWLKLFDKFLFSQMHAKGPTPPPPLLS
jgi:hypothetical protein